MMLGRDGLKIVVGLWICSAVPLFLFRVPTDATIPPYDCTTEISDFSGFPIHFYFFHIFIFTPLPPPTPEGEKRRETTNQSTMALPKKSINDLKFPQLSF